MKAVEKSRLQYLLGVYYKETRSPDAGRLINTLNNQTVSKVGRKPKYSEETRQMILNLHEENLSIRRITSITGCSIGYVQKVIKTNEDNIHTGQEKQQRRT